MPINPEAVGAISTPVERSWSSTDGLLYALGVGAGTLDAVDFELEYTTENSADRPQKVLPTFAAVVGGGGPPRATLGSFDPAMLVHGEQSIELFGPIPPDGTVRTTSEVTGIYDKGSGALVVSRSTSVDALQRRAPVRVDDLAVRPGRGGVRRRARSVVGRGTTARS